MAKSAIYFICVTAICIQAVSCRTRYHNARLGEDGKIVGGTNTTIQMYPYHAYLLLYDGRDYYQCGGSIINRMNIVTAAHCLTRIRRIFVRIGSTESNSGGSEYQTDTFYSHPRYNSRTSDYDVGVVRVSQGMNLDGQSTRAIPLVKLGYDPPGGENVVLTGWGATSQGGNVSSNLMVVQVPVVSRTRCNELLSSTITSRMFCAGTAEGGKDTCQGDSGGPAVPSSNNMLAGITSFGFGCAQPNSPGVYTNIGNMEIRAFITKIAGRS